MMNNETRFIVLAAISTLLLLSPAFVPSMDSGLAFGADTLENSYPFKKVYLASADSGTAPEDDPQPDTYIYKKARVGFALIKVEGYSKWQTYIGSFDLRKKGAGPTGSVVVNEDGSNRIQGHVYMSGRKIFYGHLDFTDSGFTIPHEASSGRTGLKGVIEYKVVSLPLVGDSETDCLANGEQLVGWEAYFTGSITVDLSRPHGVVKHEVTDVKIDEKGSMAVNFWKVKFEYNFCTFNFKWNWSE